MQDNAPAEAEDPTIAELRENLQNLLERGEVWVRNNLLTQENLIAIGTQISVVVAAILVGWFLAPRIRRVLDFGISKLPGDLANRVNQITPLILDHGLRPALWVAFLWIGEVVLSAMGLPHVMVRIAASLATAWLIIKLITQFMPEDMRKPVAWFAWSLAILSSMGILDDAWRMVNSQGIPFGEGMINAEFVLRAIIMAAVFIFAAQWLASRLKSRVETLPKVEPSLRILMANAIQIGLFIAAAFLTMTSLGIPLSGLAVFGGALGVGLGFGMQQIVANFISGVILLTDRSIKPNDVIEVDDTYGVVKSLGLRYASVITRDGKEHLIPNEMLITDKVVNWSYSNKEVRVKKRLRVEYETDLRQAVDLVVEGAMATERVLHSPKPVCLVVEFGDEAIELEARFWIDDPENGVANIASQVMLNIWDRFQEAGIDIPLRHQDVLITPGSTLQVEMVRQRKSSSGDGDA